MPTAIGTFTGPGVSAAVVLTSSVGVTAAGLAKRCQLQIEQSLDGGTTWGFLYGFDRVCGAASTDEQMASGVDLKDTYAQGWWPSTADPTKIGPASGEYGAGASAAPLNMLPISVAAGQYRLRCISLLSGAVTYAIGGT